MGCEFGYNHRGMCYVERRVPCTGASYTAVNWNEWEQVLAIRATLFESSVRVPGCWNMSCGRIMEDDPFELDTGSNDSHTESWGGQGGRTLRPELLVAVS